ncbi:hypothetical protein G9A89_020176 [Geosiphon pyriformis]|nr:hypothetical protein G9A89_020176 [Geosiphon pyriformis]
MLNWITQELVLSQNGQHIKKPKPIWEAYQVLWANIDHNELLPILLWDNNRKKKEKKEEVTTTTHNPYTYTIDPKWDSPFHIHEVLGNGAYKLRLEDRILKKSSVSQLETQISLIRPEDIPQNLEPIIIIET